VPAEVSVTDCVHAAVKTVKASGGSGPVYRASRVAERAGQLTDRHDAVLPFRQRSQWAMGG
jgi:hypothetical protein